MIVKIYVTIGYILVVSHFIENNHQHIPITIQNIHIETNKPLTLLANRLKLKISAEHVLNNLNAAKNNVVNGIKHKHGNDLHTNVEMLY